VIRFRLAKPLRDADRADLSRALGRDGGAGAVVDDAVVADGRPGAYQVAGIPSTPRVIARLAAWCETSDVLLLEVRAAGGTLEERYLELTGEAGPPEPAS
jgi:hypothetical protein